MIGPKDFLGWAKRPRSRIALEAVRSLSSRDRCFRAIWDTLVERGVVSEQGVLQKIWSGTQWQPVGEAWLSIS